jgi:tRNA(adenine34) deaminase
MIIKCRFLKKTQSLLYRNDEYSILMAYNQVIKAWKHNETPIGTIAVSGSAFTAFAYHCVITLHDPRTHAETHVITQAARVIIDRRLNGVAIVSIEDGYARMTGRDERTS